jgi:hypothetical protein
LEVIMTATASSTSADVIHPLSEQEQAAALWTYVHLRLPRFTSEDALEVVRRVAPRPQEATKALGKRLREELTARGVPIKHSGALEAAARLLGHSSWHEANRAQPGARLKLTSTSPSGGEELIADWRELAPRLCEACDEWLRHKRVRVFQIRFGPAYMMISAPQPKEGTGQFNTETWPVLVVNPVGDQAGWLDDAPAALEMLRRHLEESGDAIVDGVAVLQLCGATSDLLGSMLPQPVRAEDVCNAELILVRADHELDPGYEIARGDEMTCWSQFDLAIKDRRTEEVVFDEGAWRVGGGRYIWQVSTLHPKEVVPGLTVRELGEDDSKKLLRRYRIAKRLHAQKLSYHEQTKRVDYLGTLAETYRVDLHKLLLALRKVGLTWESYCAEVGEERPMVPELPVGFVFTLLERLKLEDPNAVFARPTRAQLSRVEDDKLLRALMPRVDHVRYRLASGASHEVKEAVREAIEDFAASLRVQKLQAGGSLVDPQNPLPYLVYASDGEELRLKLADHGLVMYAGVMPHLISTKGIVDQLPNSWPFAMGNSLFLDIDFNDRT